MEEVNQQAEGDLGHVYVCVCVYAHLLKSSPTKHITPLQSVSLKHMPCVGSGNGSCTWNNQDGVKQEHKGKLAQQ